MNAVVVDTDIVSYLFKSHPIAFQYLPHLTGLSPIISFMTVAELDRWVLEARWGEARRDRLRGYLGVSLCCRTTGPMRKMGRSNRGSSSGRAAH